MPTEPEYLTIAEAAAYLGVSPQTLRRWDSTGKLVAVRRPGGAYRVYRRADLEPYRPAYARATMQSTTIGHLFQTAIADIEENAKLRDPQREAHRAVREHFATRRDPVILQIPVGCGKTGVISTLPFGISEGRVLVIAPGVTIRRVVSEALDIASRECFWARARVLANFNEGPYVALLDGLDANIHDCTESHFVVANIQQLASSADRWLPQFPPGFFDMILVDEGHHNVAESWQKVFRRFPEAKVVSLTATPFRGDQRRPAGEVIYRYSFTRAMMKGYIKQVHSSNVAPSEITFTYRDDERRHSLEEVLRLREEQWFRRGVALAPECNRHIAEQSIRRCNELRAKTGQQHQIIAVACSIDHARQVRSLYQELGFRSAEIHSEMPDDEQEQILNRLRLAQLDCIVQVGMLGEGFDHPPLSIAAIFRPYRSLSPYIQFVGRVMRVIHQEQPDHPDNQAWIVSHVGLNNDEHWLDFRELDLDDQRLFHEWMTTEPDPDSNVDGQGAPRRFDLGMLVNSELISHFVNRPFLDPEDDRVLDQILAQPVGVGLTVADLLAPDRATARDILRSRLRAKVAAQELASDTTAVPTTPQRRRRAARSRLPERTNSVAARVLQDLTLSRNGRDICRVVGGLGQVSNVSAVTKLIHRAVNEFLGIPSGSRGTPSAAQMASAQAELDRLGDSVRTAVQAALEERRNG